MDDVACLIPQTFPRDGAGNQVAEDGIPREVFVRVGSVSRQEFHAGAASGLRPDLMLVVCRMDYEGEREAAYRGRRYAIYRTYDRPGSDRVELYLTEKAGVTHGKGEG